MNAAKTCDTCGKPIAVGDTSIFCKDCQFKINLYNVSQQVSENQINYSRLGTRYDR